MADNDNKNKSEDVKKENGAKFILLFINTPFLIHLYLTKFCIFH